MAAYIGADVTGNLRAVSQLLADAGRADTHAGSSLPAAVAAAYFVLNEDGNIATAHALLAGAIEAALQDAHVDDGTLFEALHTLMLVCFFAERAELWRPFEKTLARLAPHVPLALALSARTFADPARADASVTARLDAAIRALPEESDPTKIVRIGMAAFYVDRLGGCRDALWRVVRDGREGGAVASSIDALLEIAFDDLATGDWAETHRLATEALKLCDASGYTLLAWPARLAFALLAAARGDGAAVQELASDMITWATPRGAGVVRSYAHHARALAAIGRGDFEDAYQQSVAISPAGVLASHTAHALCVVLELVEAAVRTGRTAEASAHVAALQQANIAALSPRLGLITAGASALAAPNDDGAFLLFEQAISSPDAARWAFDLARIQLAYGERLRRARATVESRRHLGAALETFERLGAEPWTGRARNELRATGQTRTQGQLKRIILTPQEREIASLAASGLTNKQIGAQLYLSARTVGAHLYRVFPKLGITSRAALRDALAAQDEPLANDPDA
jgi:DNA-binding NarL/FixJ family response regulator